MNVNLTNTLISSVTNGVSWELDLAKIPADKQAEVIYHLARQGAKIIAQRAKSGESIEERKKALLVGIESIQNGLYSFGQGGGGRGPSLSDWDRCEREVLALKLEAICGLGRTKAQKAAQDREQAWNDITRRLVIANAGDKTPDEIAANIDAWVEKARPAVEKKFKEEIEARMPKSDTKMNLEDLGI